MSMLESVVTKWSPSWSQNPSRKASPSPSRTTSPMHQSSSCARLHSLLVIKRATTASSSSLLGWGCKWELRNCNEFSLSSLQPVESGFMHNITFSFCANFVCLYSEKKFQLNSKTHWIKDQTCVFQSILPDLMSSNCLPVTAVACCSWLLSLLLDFSSFFHLSDL